MRYAADIIRPRRFAFALGLLVLVAGRALAQTQQPKDAPVADPVPSVLRGPEVREKPTTKTLVVKDMSGKLEPLTQRPEQAAIELLGLSPEERKPIDAMFEERAAAVSKLLREHQDLFLKIQAGRQGGAAPAELRPLMMEMRGYAVDLIEPPLADQVRPLLPESKRAEFDALVGEYMKALADDGGDQPGRRGNEPRAPQRNPTPEGERNGPRALAGDLSRQRQELSMLLREVARTLNGVVTQRREQMDAFIKAVDATPEQEAKLRSIARAAAEEDLKNKGERDEARRRETWRKMMDVLTPDQRKKAIELRRGE
ncbi:MAG: hypothetical protein SFY96_06895 [Planctomycetota bacterium]|nr:hypothetical protein [Planctomycetota bacterium]